MIRAVAWLMFPVVICVLTWYSHVEYTPGYGILGSDMYGVGEPIYIVIPTLMSGIFPLGLWLMKIKHGQKIPRMMAFIGFILSIYWLSIPILVLTDFLEYTHANPKEATQLSVAVAIVAGILSLIYTLYISPSPKKQNGND